MCIRDSYYTPASLILQQAKSMGYAPSFFGCDGMDGILGMEGFDTSLAEGMMLMTPFSATDTDPATAAFVSEYQAQFNETPIQFAADGYDCEMCIRDRPRAPPPQGTAPAGGGSKRRAVSLPQMCIRDRATTMGML